MSLRMVTRNNTLKSNVRSNAARFFVIHHINRLPWTNFWAQTAPDAPIQVDFHQFQKPWIIRTRYQLNRVDRTDGQTGFAPGATVLIDDSNDARISRARRFVRISHLLIVPEVNCPSNFGRRPICQLGEYSFCSS